MTTPTDRLHSLDAVRAFALLLGIALHAAMPWMEGISGWISATEKSATLAGIWYVIHMFRMSTFFLIAGFFARMLVERRGALAFAKDRAKRIGIPLVAGYPIVMIFMGLGFLLGALPYGLEFLQNLSIQQQELQQSQANTTGGRFILAHLWFLYYLMIFYILTLPLRSFVRWLDTENKFRDFTDKIIRAVMSGPWAPVVIAIPLILYFYFDQSWGSWIGLPAPFYLPPNLQAIVGYGIPFALGWLLHRQIPVLLDLQKYWMIYFCAAVTLTVISYAIAGPVSMWGEPYLEGNTLLINTIAYMVGLWCWILFFVGAAIRFLSDVNPRIRYLADASYWIYLVHMTPIAFFHVLLYPLDWHWSIKYTITVVGSMPLLIASYHYLVRFTWIGLLLNGRRHPRPGASQSDGKVATTEVALKVEAH